MKAHTLLLAALLLASSCNKLDITASHTSNTTSQAAAYSVSEADADRLIAIHRPGQTYSVDSVGDDDTPLLYIYNFRDGWMVVSGDRRTTPILGESDYGNLDVNTASEGVVTWLGLCADDVRRLKSNPELTNEDNVNIWNNISPRDTSDQCHSSSLKWVVKTDRITVNTSQQALIPHMTNTSWGQTTPWNTKLPYDDKAHHRCFLGCTSVAFAQLIYYTHHHLGVPEKLHHNINIGKTNINGSTQDIGFSASGLTYGSERWDQMALTSNADAESIEYAQNLIIDVGNRFGTYYSGLGSGAMPSNEGIEYFGLHCSTGDYSYQTVIDNLHRGLPVMIAAYATKKRTGIWPFKSTSYSDGHCWLIDGIDRTAYSYSCERHCEYTDAWDADDEVFDTFAEVSARYGIASAGETFVTGGGRCATDYLLMNWGFDGAYDNAHFSISSDAVWAANGYNYQYKKTIYYDIH